MTHTKDGTRADSRSGRMPTSTSSAADGTPTVLLTGASKGVGAACVHEL